MCVWEGEGKAGFLERSVPGTENEKHNGTKWQRFGESEIGLDIVVSFDRARPICICENRYQ